MCGAVCVLLPQLDFLPPARWPAHLAPSNCPLVSPTAHTLTLCLQVIVVEDENGNVVRETMKDTGERQAEAAGCALLREVASMHCGFYPHGRCMSRETYVGLCVCL